MVLEQDGTDLLNDSATIDNHACLSAWAPAQQPVYANRGYTGAAVQVLRTLYRNMLQNSVIQAVVFFPTKTPRACPCSRSASSGRVALAKPSRSPPQARRRRAAVDRRDEKDTHRSGVDHHHRHRRERHPRHRDGDAGLAERATGPQDHELKLAREDGWKVCMTYTG